jgi:SAM-dependent methyltransferase
MKIKKLLSKIYNKFVSENLFVIFYSFFLYLLNFNKKIQYRRMLNSKNSKDRFIKIYNQNIWNSNESKSGEGSEINHTKNISSWIKLKTRKYKVKFFVDAGCGDLNWMKFVLKKTDFKYLGVDIVPQIIKNNNKMFSSKNIKFKLTDIRNEKLPRCEMIMARDCLIHFSYSDINKFLNNLNKTEYKYLLTTTHVNPKIINHDIITGDYRMIDIFKKPFNFKKKEVIEFINDFPPGAKFKRKLILIKKENVPKFLSIY